MFEQFQQKKSNKSGIFAAGIIGAMIGAVAGLLYAPKSGKETRKDLGNWMNDMTDEIQEQMKKTKNRTQERYNEVVDSLSDKYRKMQFIKDTELDDFTTDLKKRWDRVKDSWNDDEAK